MLASFLQTNGGTVSVRHLNDRLSTKSMFTFLTSKSRILLADPCPDTVESTACLLKLWGFDVRAVGTGRAVCEAARDYRPNAVLLEIGLPGIDGWQVARQLRCLRLQRPPLLVAVTVCSSTRDKILSREAGFDCHFVKPVSPDTLRAWLITHCGMQGGQMTRNFKQIAMSRSRDVVDIASEDSFPASDPPSWTPVVRAGGPRRNSPQAPAGNYASVQSLACLDASLSARSTTPAQPGNVSGQKSGLVIASGLPNQEKK
jgi:two-component system OmpR family response regulator